MNIQLENENFKAIFAAKGAELQSIFNKKLGIEYMWSGDPEFWSKYSPILFPIVGSLKNDTYYYHNQSYHLPRHGFARETVFQVHQQSKTAVSFSLNHSTETLKVYPFYFELIVRYILTENELTCIYEVTNKGKDEMLFSIGAHPAFAVPMIDSTNYEDYDLTFNRSETVSRCKLEAGLISDKTEPLLLNSNVVNLSKSLFYEDAIVLKNLSSDCIRIGSSKHPHGLNFYFNNFPYFGIWAAKDAPFVCLEPWCGIADSTTHNQQLTTKEGINYLAPEQHWQRSWKVECF
jgi:hypothetical protein